VHVRQVQVEQDHRGLVAPDELHTDRPLDRGDQGEARPPPDDALHQAQFNAYLLEKYHAHFCNQYHLTYDQMLLIIKEGREKNWPLPPAPPDE